MIVFPYKTDSLTVKKPVVNLFFSFSILIVSLLFISGNINGEWINLIISPKWNALKSLAVMVIQPDFLTMIFVFLFLIMLGNSVNSLFGNLYYFIMVAAAALIGSFVHSLTNYMPAIGAFGVVSAVSGAAFITLPSNKLILYKTKEDEETGISIIALVVLWFIFNFYAISHYKSISGLWGQAASFLSGGLISYLLIKLKLINVFDPVFSEWLHDKILLISNSDRLAAIMPGSKKETSNGEIKMKAEKLIHLFEQESDIFNENTGAFKIQEENEKKEDKKSFENNMTDIKFRILKQVKLKDNITLYFIYEGKKITGITITGDNYRCEVFPSEKLGTGDSGSIKIFTKAEKIPDNFRIKLNYEINGSGSAKELIYSAAAGELKE